eukprot:437907-Ditylum_brightwellii.AAC.1
MPRSGKLPKRHRGGGGNTCLSKLMGGLTQSRSFNISEYIVSEGQIAIIPLLRILLESWHPVCEAYFFVFPGTFCDKLEGVE